MSNNKNSLTFDYNKIRELTGKLKDNLKNKYDNLHELTNELNTSNAVESLNISTQNSVLQTTIIDNYLNQIESFFGDGLYEADVSITGTLITDIIEANDIFIRSANNQSLSSVIQKINSLNEDTLFTNFLKLIKSQDLRLNNQTLYNPLIYNPTVNGGTLFNITVNGGVLNNVTIPGITNKLWIQKGSTNRRIYNAARSRGVVGIGTSNPSLSYKLDVLGATNIKGNTTITGSVGINNNNPTYNLDISGNVRISNNLDVSGNVQITNNLDVFGNVDVSGNVDVYGNAHFFKNLIVDASAYVIGSMGIGTKTITKGAILDLSSNHLGFLPPRMKAIEALNINGGIPPIGTIVFCFDAIPPIITPGWWGYRGNSPGDWVQLG
jgi:cytoskeletal protein CcmA (bactofilin family)